MDLDSQRAFDFLIMTWVFKVFIYKGEDMRVINRLKRLYEDSFTRISINNIRGEKSGTGECL